MWLCLALVVGLVVIFSLIALSNAMGKMPAQSDEKQLGNFNQTWGIRYKDDCNDDNSWTG